MSAIAWLQTRVPAHRLEWVTALLKWSGFRVAKCLRCSARGYLGALHPCPTCRGLGWVKSYK